jgi:hypothetical protein
MKNRYLILFALLLIIALSYKCERKPHNPTTQVKSYKRDIKNAPWNKKYKEKRYY